MSAALVAILLAPTSAHANDPNPIAEDTQPCVTAANRDRQATTWLESHAVKADPRLAPYQQLYYIGAVDYYLECASRRDTPPRLRLTARVRALEIDDAIGNLKGEYAILGDIAHDQSVPLANRERAKDDYFKICRTVLLGHDEDDIHTYCNAPFDSDAIGAGALHDRLANAKAVGPGVKAERAHVAAQQTARCSTPNVDAAVIGNAHEPEYPSAESSAGIGGTVEIKIRLDETGAISDASVYKSTGNAELDEAALQAAKATSYSPSMRNCVPISGSYIFTSEFSAVKN